MTRDDLYFRLSLVWLAVVLATLLLGFFTINDLPDSAQSVRAANEPAQLTFKDAR